LVFRGRDFWGTAGLAPCRGKTQVRTPPIIDFYNVTVQERFIACA
jgi:hypothetical protein